MHRLITFALVAVMPVMTHAATIQGEAAANLPAPVKAVLSAVAERANVSSLAVTSADRTPEQHARIMVVDKMHCGDGKCPGAQKVLDDYCPEHDRAVNTLLADKSWKTADQAIAVLAAALVHELPANRTCVMHVVVPGQVTDWKAVDVAPSSIPDGQKCKFLEEATKEPMIAKARVFVPPTSTCAAGVVKQSETAFHIEIKQKH